MSNKVKVLIYEKDQNLSHLLQEYLQMKEFDADIYDDVYKVEQASMTIHYLIALLDIDAGNIAETDMARNLRISREDVALIYLSSSPEKRVAISAFQAGADDFIKKPFNLEELEARIRAILWRMQGEKLRNTVYYQLGKFFFDTRKQTLTTENNELIALTTKECALLTLLCQHANKVVERSFALRAVWKDDSYFSARSMDVYITKLRKLLKSDPELSIVNIHGHGYRLVTRSGEL